MVGQASRCSDFLRAVPKSIIMNSLAIYLNKYLPSSLKHVSKEDLFEWCTLKDPDLLWNVIELVFRYNGVSLKE